MALGADRHLPDTPSPTAQGAGVRFAAGGGVSSLGVGLTVGRRALDPQVEVRTLDPEPIHEGCAGRRIVPPAVKPPIRPHPSASVELGEVRRWPVLSRPGCHPAGTGRNSRGSPWLHCSGKCSRASLSGGARGTCPPAGYLMCRTHQGRVGPESRQAGTDAAESGPSRSLLHMAPPGLPESVLEGT